MRIALLLQKRCVLGVVPRLWTRSAHMCQIKGGRMCAPHETHEISDGKQGICAYRFHVCIPNY